MDGEAAGKRKRATPRFTRNTFLTGLLILIPLVATYLLVAFLFDLLSGAGAPVMRTLFGPLRQLESLWWLEPITPVANIVLALAIIFLLGLVGTNFIGRKILDAVNTLILRLPLVSGIYSAVKQMVETFQGPSGSFQRVVLLQYPRKEMWVMGAGCYGTGRHAGALLCLAAALRLYSHYAKPNLRVSGYGAAGGGG